MFNSKSSKRNTMNPNKESNMYTVTVLEHDDKRDYIGGRLGRKLNQIFIGGRKATDARRISKNRKNWKKNNPNIAGCI